MLGDSCDYALSGAGICNERVAVDPTSEAQHISAFAFQHGVGDVCLRREARGGGMGISGRVGIKKNGLGEGDRNQGGLGLGHAGATKSSMGGPTSLG